MNLSEDDVPVTFRRHSAADRSAARHNSFSGSNSSQGNLTEQESTPLSQSASEKRRPSQLVNADPRQNSNFSSATERSQLTAASNSFRNDPAVKIQTVKKESEDEDDDDDSLPLARRMPAASAESFGGAGSLPPVRKRPFAAEETGSASVSSIKKPKGEEASRENGDSAEEDDVPLSERLKSSPAGKGFQGADEEGDESDEESATESEGSEGEEEEEGDSSEEQDEEEGAESEEEGASEEDIERDGKRMRGGGANDEEDTDEDMPLSQRLSKSPAKGSPADTTNESRSNALASNSASPSKAMSAVLRKEGEEERKRGRPKGAVAKQREREVEKKTTRGGKSASMSASKRADKVWTTLEHCGVIFPPPYQPHGIQILYKGKTVALTPEQEEVATMFAVMRETDYAQKETFLKNFWEDWRQMLGRKHEIQDLKNCDFTPIWEWHLREKEKKKNMTTEEKKRLKEEKAKAEEKYMWAIVDGVKEKVGNFRVEPPGLFRGRGEHPKMGKVKRRIYPEDIVINIGRDAKVPECPIPGRRWKEVRHDNTVTWLAFWLDPINSKDFKYVFLAASSSIKGLSDMEKYEKARKLKDYITSIRDTYTRNFNSKDLQKRQISVATYLIDRLALRAGNEKDEDEADTVGCCSLKASHVKRIPPRSLQFDFLGKDSIRYFNTVDVLKPVYDAIGDFQKNKKQDEDIFDQLDTAKLNAHLKEIMPGLTAKVFRTYNASITLDRLLQDTVGSTVLERSADYQRANKEVAILCNHQKTVSKNHAGQIERIETKMKELEESIEEMSEDLSRLKKGLSPLKSKGEEKGARQRAPSAENLEKKIAQGKARLEKMRVEMRVKEDLKTVALGTSKINYLDPRITVAWCKKHEVPIEKIFNKSLLAKFAWAMDVSPDFRF